MPVLGQVGVDAEDACFDRERLIGFGDFINFSGLFADLIIKTRQLILQVRLFPP